MVSAHAQIMENHYTEDDYYNTPEDIRVELIDGLMVYNQASPSRIHQAILGELCAIINNYIKSKEEPCRVYPGPFAVKLKEGYPTIVEPDISVICDPDRLTERGCTGAPDWIIEIVSPGNPGHDYVRKLALYVDAGVREYWIVDPGKERIHVYLLEEDNFDLTIYTFQDKIKAGIYEELWIDFTELQL